MASSEQGNWEDVLMESCTFEHEVTLEARVLLGRCCPGLPGEESRRDQKGTNLGRGKSASRLPAALVRPEWFLWAGVCGGRDLGRNL